MVLHVDCHGTFRASRRREGCVGGRGSTQVIAAGNPRDILATLTSEKAAVLGWLSVPDGMLPGPEAFDCVQNSMLAHARWVSSELYPEIASRTRDEVSAEIRLARAAYRILTDDLLPRSRESNADREDRGRAIRAMRELLDRLLSIETVIFDAARNTMTREELEDLDQRYEDWRHSTSAALLIAESMMKEVFSASSG